MDPLIRTAEGCDEQPFLLWDTLWSNDTFSADWALADADEHLNRGGLRSKAALETAVTLALFTDRRVPEDHPLRYLAGTDPRGWWGDGVDVRDDLYEQPLGSLLWVLERAPLTIEIVRWAKAMAEDALAPLVAQGACVRIEVEAERVETKGMLRLTARLFGRDGASIFDRAYEVIWSQLGAA